MGPIDVPVIYVLGIDGSGQREIVGTMTTRSCYAGSDYPPGMSFAGENIAAARLWGSLTLADIVETSFGDFVNSPWHNAAMLNADTTHIGVGVVLKAEWVWITQNFGQRQPSTAALSPKAPG